MLFWTIAIAITLACGAILARAALQARPGTEAPAAYDLRVYRDQLKEIERDLARGVIGPEDAERVRTEVSRRILAADAKLQAEGGILGQPKAAGYVLAVLSVVVLIGGAGSLYALMGAPGMRDLPLAERIAASEAKRQERLSQAEVEASLPGFAVAEDVSEDYLALMERLRETIKERPDDVRGLRLLVRNEAALGNLVAAHQAQAQLIEARGPEAEAVDYALLTDLMVSAARGYVSTDAELAMRAALSRDPDEPRALYYMGVYMLQVDRPDTAFRVWDGLLAVSDPRAPWVPLIREQIEEIAWRGGVIRYELPPLPEVPAQSTNGPSAEDIEAAQEMSAEDQAAMIQGMVGQLAERLATEGGSAEEWARLIGAYGVLGEPERAAAIWTEAQEVFAGRDADLETLRAAARSAGVAE